MGLVRAEDASLHSFCTLVTFHSSSRTSEASSTLLAWVPALSSTQL